MKKIYVLLFVLCINLGCSKEEIQPDPPKEEIPDEEEPDIEDENALPGVRSSVAMTFTGSSVVEVNKPEKATEGDLLLLIMAKNGGQFSKPAEEEGWVRIVSHNYGSGVPLIRAWWKKVTSNDPDQYKFITGSSSNNGRIDLICIKNWNGSAPTSVSTNHASNSTFPTPSIPSISPTGGDLLITTVAVAAPSGLANTSWSSSEGFTMFTNLTDDKVTMASAQRSGHSAVTPAEIAGNIFSLTGMSISRSAAVLSFVVPADSERPVVRVYKGGAARTYSNDIAYHVSNESIIQILSDPSLGYDVRSIGENEVDKITVANLNETDLYVQPGGPTITVGWPYLSPYKSLIRNYVDNGGRYLGVCFGAYMLRNYYEGESFDLLPEENYAYTYSSHSGSTYGGGGAEIVTLQLHENWGNEIRSVPIVGGNYFYLPGTVPDLRNLATYEQPNGMEPRAAIRFSYNGNNDDKKGWLIGIGPHPDSTPTWGGPADPDGADDDLIRISAADLLSR